MQLINFIKDRILGLISEENAQDGIEYLLVVGGISVAVIVAALVLVDGIDGIVAQVQALVDGVLGTPAPAPTP